jgi:K+/H+ antiporter YhaU regulatory subunit KhtT
MDPAAIEARAGLDPEGAMPEVREGVVGTGALADLSLGEALVRERFGVTVVSGARVEGGAVVNPSAEMRLRPGDRLRAFGLPEQIDAFRGEAGRGL